MATLVSFVVTTGLMSVATYRHLHSPSARTPANPFRVIAHCDVDAAYAQFEAVRIGSPDNVPLIVVQWETIIAVNYPARPYGIKRCSSMGPKEARELCPHVVIVHTATYRPGDGESGYWDDADVMTHKVSLDPYRRESAKILAIFKEMVPNGEIEKASIDEAYMDLTAMVIERLLNRFPHLRDLPSDAPDAIDSPLPPPPHIAWPGTVNLIPTDQEARQAVIDNVSDDEDAEGVDRRALVPAVTWGDWALFVGGEIMAEVRKEIWDRLHYTCSAGIAHNKAMAKLCSSQKKPNGQTILRHAAVPRFLRAKDFTDIRYLGGKLGRAIAEEYRATTVDDLLKVRLSSMQNRFGEESIWIYNVIRGIDESPLIPRQVSKSMLASKNIIPGVFRASEGLPWIDLLAGELLVRLCDARELEPGLWPKTLCLSWRIGFGYGNNLRSKQAPFPYTKRLSAEHIASLGRRLWAAAAPLISNAKGVMDVHNLALAFNDVGRMEKGQARIEGFIAKRARSDTPPGDSSLKPAPAPLTCAECAHVATCEIDMQEHQDWHFARRIAREDRASSRPAPSPAKKAKTKDGIRAFFKPR